ncbi:MAG: hypothetical protein GX887_03290 [Firmicutes bacterium]|nr:hypothetical protein [Bacillota bacterium]
MALAVKVYRCTMPIPARTSIITVFLSVSAAKKAGVGEERFPVSPTGADTEPSKKLIRSDDRKC